MPKRVPGRGGVGGDLDDDRLYERERHGPAAVAVEPAEGARLHLGGPRVIGCNYVQGDGMLEWRAGATQFVVPLPGILALPFSDQVRAWPHLCIDIGNGRCSQEMSVTMDARAVFRLSTSTTGSRTRRSTCFRCRRRDGADPQAPGVGRPIVARIQAQAPWSTPVGADPKGDGTRRQYERTD